MSVPVHLPSIDGYVVSMAKRNDKLFRRSFRYITPPGEDFDLNETDALGLMSNLRLTVPAKQVISAISTWQTDDSAIQVDQMIEACLDWIGRTDTRYLVSRPTPDSNPNEMRGSYVIWASKEGHRTINHFTAMQAVLHVAAAQARGNGPNDATESYLGLRESYDRLKKAFVEAQIKFGTISTRTASFEGASEMVAETEKSKLVKELRHALADETRDSVVQWQKSMVKLATDLDTTSSQRTTAQSSPSAAWHCPLFRSSEPYL